MQYAPPDVPWHRVVGAGGLLPIGKRSPELLMRQIRLLEREGALFVAGATDRVDMARSQWLPDDAPIGGLFPESD
jgi:alkylated DNA nucleotide flippase Atl1